MKLIGALLVIVISVYGGRLKCPKPNSACVIEYETPYKTEYYVINMRNEPVVMSYVVAGGGGYRSAIEEKFSSYTTKEIYELEKIEKIINGRKKSQKQQARIKYQWKSIGNTQELFDVERTLIYWGF